MKVKSLFLSVLISALSNVFSAGNRQARLEIGAGHFFERGFGGYLFDEVIGLTTSWFDNTLKVKKQ